MSDPIEIVQATPKGWSVWEVTEQMKPDVSAELENIIEEALKDKPTTPRGEGFENGLLYIKSQLKRITKLKELSK